MSDNPFETVAIAHSQAQADVILSLFAWHDIPAYAKNIEHARADPPMTLALGAFPIMVFADYAEEARALLVEAEANASEALSEPLGDRVAKVVLGMVGLVPQPKVSAEIIG